MAKAEKPLPVKRLKIKPENQEKYDLAQLLFTRNNMPLNEVAQRVGVQAKTLGIWCKDGMWEDLRRSLLTSKDEQLTMLYDQLDELNKTIKKRPDGQRFAAKGEADTISKLTAAIRSMETETNVGQIIDVAKDLISWIMPNDPAKGRELTKLFDSYIKAKLRRK